MLFGLVWIVVLMQSSTLGCGMSVHNMVSKLALDLWKQQPSLAASDQLAAKEAIVSFPQYFQSGSFFPDWGYPCTGQEDAAETAHWPPFFNATTEYVRSSNFSNPKLLAFYFGIVSHGVADVLWHSLGGMEEGFINAIYSVNFHGKWSQAHTVADIGGEIILAQQSSLSFMESVWHFPTADMVAIYRSMNISVRASDINRCMMLGWAGAFFNKMYGRLAFPFAAPASPYLVDQLFSYPRGGILDMAATVTRCWNDAVDWLNNGSTPDQLFCQSSPKIAETLKQNLEEDEEEYVLGPRLKPKNRNSRLDLGLKGDIWSTSAIVQLTAFFNWPTLSSSVPTSPTVSTATEIPVTLITHSNLLGKFMDRIIPPLPVRFISRLSSLFKEMAQHSLDVFARGVDALGISTISHGAKCIPWSHASTNFLSLETDSVTTNLVKGDFNGDGFEDVAIGLPFFSVSEGNLSIPHLGTVKIIFGSDGVNLSSTFLYPPFNEPPVVKSSAILIPTSEDIPNTWIASRCGLSLASADLNKDGIDDLIFGCPGFGSNQMTFGGAVFVYYGRRGPITKSLAPNVGFIENGRSVSKYLGFGSLLYGSVDLDGDGFADVLVGSMRSPAPVSSPYFHQQGCVSSLLSSRVSLDPSTADTGNGFKYLSASSIISWTIENPGLYNDYQGFGTRAIQVITTNDNNNHSLLFIGAPDQSDGNMRQVGAVYVYRLVSSSTSLKSPPVLVTVLNGKNEFEMFGSSIFHIPTLSLIAIGACGKTNRDAHARLLDFVGIMSPDRGFAAGSIYFFSTTLLQQNNMIPRLEIRGTSSWSQLGMVSGLVYNGYLFLPEPTAAKGAGRLISIPLSTISSLVLDQSRTTIVTCPLLLANQCVVGKNKNDGLGSTKLLSANGLLIYFVDKSTIAMVND